MRHAPELFLRNLCAVALVTVFSTALPCFRIRSLPRIGTRELPTGFLAAGGASASD
jgi:hypothetical protein